MAGPRRYSLLRLWLVVSVLWTVATVLRLPGAALSFLAWPAWLSFLLPPLMFAVILAAVHQIALARGAPRPVSDDRRAP
jgi:hypothetical protein